MEQGLASIGNRVDAVDEQRVEVRGDVERRVEALDDGDGPRLERPADAVPPGAPPEPAGDRGDEFAKHHRGQRRIDGELRAQPVRHGEDPLPDGHARHDPGHQARGELAHPTAGAARAEAPALAGECNGPAPAAVAALHEDEAVRQNPASKESLYLRVDERGQCRWVGTGLHLRQECLPLGLEDPEEDGLFRPMSLVGEGPRARAWTVGGRPWGWTDDVGGADLGHDPASSDPGAMGLRLPRPRARRRRTAARAASGPKCATATTRR
jgi:hypothetical protein